MLFVIPWERHWIIGTTDTDWAGSKARPVASRADIDYLLGQANRVLATPLTRDDVTAVYAGLRPLLSGESDLTSQLSREHVVANPVPGLVLVAGGKYTTYRLMARDAVDAVVHGLDWRTPPSCTDRVPLAGADGYLALWNARRRLATSSGLHVARIEHLLRRYGSLAREVLSLIAADPSLGRPLAGADDYLRAEILYAASHEGARHLDDVLARRTHIAMETADRGLEVAEEAAVLVAGAAALGFRPDGQGGRALPGGGGGAAGLRGGPERLGRRVDRRRGGRHRAGARRGGRPPVTPPPAVRYARTCSRGNMPLTGLFDGWRTADLPAVHRRPTLHSGWHESAGSGEIGNPVSDVYARRSRCSPRRRPVLAAAST